MKKFIFMLLTAAAEGAVGAASAVQAAAAKPEPQSETLTKLREEYKTQWAKMAGLEPGSTEAESAMLETYKVKKAIEAEIANIRKAEAEAVLAEKRSAIVGKLDELLAAHDANLAVQADKKASIEAKNEAYDRLKNVRVELENRLLGGLSARATATATANSDKPAGTKGQTSKEIHDKLTAYIAGGMTSTEAVKAVIAEGYSRGTTGAVRTQMVKDGEIAA
jgi:hypothetical protein